MEPFYRISKYSVYGIPKHSVCFELSKPHCPKIHIFLPLLLFLRCTSPIVQPQPSYLEHLLVLCMVRFYLEVDLKASYNDTIPNVPWSKHANFQIGPSCYLKLSCNLSYCSLNHTDHFNPRPKVLNNHYMLLETILLFFFEHLILWTLIFLFIIDFQSLSWLIWRTQNSSWLSTLFTFSYSFSFSFWSLKIFMLSWGLGLN